MSLEIEQASAVGIICLVCSLLSILSLEKIESTCGERKSKILIIEYYLQSGKQQEIFPLITFNDNPS